MRTFRLRAAVCALLATVVVGPLAAPQANAAVAHKTSVIVQKQAGSGTAPEDYVRSVGGHIDYDLSIIDGFAATLDDSQLAGLRATSGVSFVTEDAPARMQGLLDNVGGTLDAATSALLPSDQSDVVDQPAAPEQVDNPTPPMGTPQQPADTDLGNATVYQDEINASQAHGEGVTGSGVTVALIDTGVAAVPDLANVTVPVRTPAGGTKTCVNLSGEKNCNDSYGHGTFIAGLIAGSGAASGGKFAGVAPDAKVLSVKIAGRDGSASVGKIIYAIQWVTQHKSQYGVKVMNLSLGTDSTQSYKFDPLNYAVEKAWNSGISVVVSAGNRGPGARTISKPADDPLVITTGAVDDLKTAAVNDDILPDFSSHGPTAADGLTKPDLTAPGAHLISLRSPNSAVENAFPGGGVDTTYRRGSGTSQSAGVVSGSVALLLSAHPELTPNHVKYALTHSTQAVASTDANAVGSGLLDIGAAIDNLPVGEANQGVALASGRGSLKASQGSIRLALTNGSSLLGVLGAVIPVKGNDPTNPTGGSWYGSSWYGGSWYGGSWYGGSWYGTPAGGSWYGGSWYGGSWYGGSWYGGSWYGGSWYGSWD